MQLAFEAVLASDRAYVTTDRETREWIANVGGTIEARKRPPEPEAPPPPPEPVAVAPQPRAGARARSRNAEPVAEAEPEVIEISLDEPEPEPAQAARVVEEDPIAAHIASVQTAREAGGVPGSRSV